MLRRDDRWRHTWGKMSTRDEKTRVALLQGTLDLLILRTLRFGKQHGQGIARAIQEQSEDVLLVEHGALYPALQRLEAQGWITAEWGISSNQPQGAVLHAEQTGAQAACRGSEPLAHAS